MRSDMEAAIRYAHDCGYDEWYEAAMQEVECAPECEVYVVRAGYLCGNCGAVLDAIPVFCSCGARVASIVEEGEADGGAA